MEHKFCSKGTIATNAQKNESTPKSSCIGHHWKYSNYAWQKTINKSAFEPGAAAVSCGEMGWKKLKYPRGVLSFFFFLQERSTLFIYQQCSIQLPHIYLFHSFKSHINGFHLGHTLWSHVKHLNVFTLKHMDLKLWYWVTFSDQATVEMCII